MQLKKRKNGQVLKSLGLVTANLFMATHGMAQAIDDVANELGTTSLDTALLFYQESGDRVRAIEPVSSLKITGENGNVLSARVTYDSLTGATPNGAAPWTGSQLFTTPAPPPDENMSVTSASGRKTYVTIPGTGTRVAQYTAAANELPLDAGFKDTRYALDLGYSSLWDTDTTTSFGLSGSKEKDFTSYSLNAAISQALFDKNTTLGLGLNLEFDTSNPQYGIPTAMTEMNGLLKGPSDSKTVTSINAGITQVMNRIWLFQLNYNIGWSNGYQTDPYKIVSLVNPVTGAPVKYLYESRPDSRVRQSVYMANKIALGSTVADISLRYYHDDWGINSITAEVSDRIPVTDRLFIEPEARYYTQDAADFFNYYLLNGSALPEFASADGRLAKFNAWTLGVKLGYSFTPDSEVYLVAEDYKQKGDAKVAGAPGALANETFFSGVHAASLMMGFKFRF